MNFFETFLTYSQDRPMIFTGSYFWFFYAFVLIVYSFIYKRHFTRSAFLFAVSLFFYYKSSGLFFFILIFSTLVDYSIGLAIYNSKSQNRKKILIFLSVFVNLALLGYYKYSYFFTEQINILLGTDFRVVDHFAILGNQLFNANFSIDEIILPVGISFYTFQTISYSIDVYRGRLKPVKNIIDFGFYVSYFPQLVAGPIVRAAEFIPQIYEKYRLTKEDFGIAIFYIINGLIKKMVISDYISLNFVDRVFDNPGTYTGFENLVAVYGYALQIYCDFSGYTDIAIGVSLLLGFSLPLNFNSPYKADSITDFWRRWHISLSSWLKDYLYISLGGNKKGKFRQYINLLLTMLLGGLWHGANIRFVIWGALHGVGLAFHKLWMYYVPLAKNTSKAYRIVSIIITFHFVCFAWIFFRAKDMDNINIMLLKIFGDFDIQLVAKIITSYWKIFLILFVGYLIHWLPSSIKSYYKTTFIKTPVWIKIIFVVITVLIVYQSKSADVQPFIYFQF
ncbi:MAG: MBOAT family protein [Bacteroidales bacterium]|nr:MBOAT family protein [Bacteroidales bacterium]